MSKKTLSVGLMAAAVMLTGAIGAQRQCRADGGAR